MNKQRKLLVTSALPYANGPLHFGHLVEHIQTDIWVRFQKMHGADCIAVCGEDAHGTPIMLKADKLGITPEALIEDVKKSHEADFADFYIEYDNYHTTHSPENQELSSLIYQRLQANGDIEKRTISQAFDEEKQLFLPDRYVKGECPRCNAKDQYGDNCEQCGATYNPLDLKNPISSLSGSTPIVKESEHYFFDLPRHEKMLRDWINNGHIQAQVTHKLNEWFDTGLQQWDISRDAPYFGFEIPGAPGKYFYVWLDAPMGYIASFQDLCNKRNDLNFNDFWSPDSDVELHHFIGKDIIYFHALFWPAILHASGFRTPTKIHAHGFLTVNGQKMSKSRGTFINARTYLDHLNPEYLRYYFAAKLNSQIEDIDLNFNDFTTRVNSDLVGKLVNIASRSAGFLNKKFDNTLSDSCCNQALLDEFIAKQTTIAEYYDQLEYAKAIREIMALADAANRYIDDTKPWQLIKEAGNEHDVHAICSLAINLFRILMIYLKPVLPKMAKDVEAFLNCDAMQWPDAEKPLFSHQIKQFTPLMQRVDPDNITALQDDAKKEIANT